MSSVVGYYHETRIKNYDQSKVELNEEERAIREENLKARPYYDIDGIRALYSAVALKTIKDYEMYIRLGSKGAGMELCEAFLNSHAFGALYNGADAHDIRKKIERRMKEGGGQCFARNHYRIPFVPKDERKTGVKKDGSGTGQNDTEHRENNCGAACAGDPDGNGHGRRRDGRDICDQGRKKDPLDH